KCVNLKVQLIFDESVLRLKVLRSEKGTLRPNDRLKQFHAGLHSIRTQMSGQSGYSAGRRKPRSRNWRITCREPGAIEYTVELDFAAISASTSRTVRLPSHRAI